MSAPPFKTVDKTIHLEGIPFALTLVSNVDDLMEALLAKGDDHEDVLDERIPYWADLWPSAIALGRHLISRQLIRPGMTVTEVGCGLGLPGIVAGRLGAEVTLTDYLPDALRFARLNWERNVDHPARYRQMDWREPDPALAADWVLAADVAYEERFFEYLSHAFRTLCRPGGAILLSEPNRAIARPFLLKLPALGFSVEKTVYTGSYEGTPYRVNVYELRPSV